MGHKCISSLCIQVATFNRAHIFPGALTARFSLKRRVLGVLEVLAVISFILFVMPYTIMCSSTIFSMNFYAHIKIKIKSIRLRLDMRI
jgi:hypothetical protein